VLLPTSQKVKGGIEQEAVAGKFNPNPDGWGRI
jgi:hypothetical protein